MDRQTEITVTDLKKILEQMEIAGHGALLIKMDKSVFIRDLVTVTNTHHTLYVPCFGLTINEGISAPRRNGI
jgi:hypothetical protein